jgi:hypothetical protein
LAESVRDVNGFFVSLCPIFDFDGWHVKNTIIVGHDTFCSDIGDMDDAHFFVLSGIASFYALRCGSGVYLGGRVKRLLLPFLFGTFCSYPTPGVD